MQLPEKLYHISIFITHDGTFKPKVPSSTTIMEDKTIPRICFTDSIENSLSAMPCGGSNLEGTIYDSPVFKVFALDVNQEDNDLISNIETPENLYYNSYVVDALQSQEHWVTKDLKFTRENTFYIKVNKYKIRKLPILFYKQVSRVIEDTKFQNTFPNITENDLIHVQNLDDEILAKLEQYFIKNDIRYYNGVKVYDLEYEVYNKVQDIPLPGYKDLKIAV